MIDRYPYRDPLVSTGSLTNDERDHLAARPDWAPILADIERLFAQVEDTPLEVAR